MGSTLLGVSGAELGQAQAKLELDFTSVNLHSIDEQEILLARLSVNKRRRSLRKTKFWPISLLNHCLHHAWESVSSVRLIDEYGHLTLWVLGFWILVFMRRATFYLAPDNSLPDKNFIWPQAKIPNCYQIEIQIWQKNTWEFISARLRF